MAKVTTLDEALALLVPSAHLDADSMWERIGLDPELAMELGERAGRLFGIPGVVALVLLETGASLATAINEQQEA